MSVCVGGWGDGGHMRVDCRLPIVQQVTDFGRMIIPYDLFVSSTTVLCFGLKTKSLRMFAPTVTAHPFCTSNIIHVGMSCHVIHHTWMLRMKYNQVRGVAPGVLSSPKI